MTTTKGDKMKNMGSDFRARLEAHTADDCYLTTYRWDGDVRVVECHDCGREISRETFGPIPASDYRIARYTESIGRGTR